MSAGELAPSYGVIEATWEENEDQSAAFSNDGEADILELGDPFWTINVKVEIVSRAHFDEWDAFLSRRWQSALTFTMWRSLRIRPRDPAITGDTGLAVSGINVASSQITLSGYGAGRAAHYGDMISYRTPGLGYWVGKVVSPATADGSGNITIEVWPRPVTPHGATQQVRRFFALGEFRLLKKPKKTEGHNEWSLRFEAEQVLR